MRISHSGYTAQHKGDNRNHVLQDPYVDVVFWSHRYYLDLFAGILVCLATRSDTAETCGLPKMQVATSGRRNTPLKSQRPHIHKDPFKYNMVYDSIVWYDVVWHKAINIRILHSGSRVQHEGDSKIMVCRIECLCGPWGSYRQLLAWNPGTAPRVLARINAT